MERQTPHPTQQLSLPGDVYRIQRRPGTAQLILNDNYQGLRVFDPWSASNNIQAAFPDGYDSTGIVHVWCFRADGQAALVLNAESHIAAWMPLSLTDPHAGQAFMFPAAYNPLHVRCLWEDDTLLITDKSQSFLRLVWSDGQPTLIPSTSLDVRIQEPIWRRALDRLPQACTILRQEADTQRMLYYEYTEQLARIGIISWRNQSEDWSIPAPDTVFRLASSSQSLFVLQESEVQQWNRDGALEAIYAAPTGYRCFDLDTLATHNNTVTLAVLCTPESGSMVDQLLLYTLEDE